MKGYKVFNSDWACKGFQYEVGQTYEMAEKPKCCSKGGFTSANVWLIVSTTTDLT